MILFWIICSLLLVIAMLFAVLPLWRNNLTQNAVERDGANLEIIKDQFTEMDTDLKNGLLSQEMLDQGKSELRSRLLNEVNEHKTVNTTLTGRQIKILALVISILVPISAVGLYWKVGNRHALLQQKGSNTELSDGFHTPNGIQELEENVANNSEDLNSLVMLARIYGERGRYSDSVKLYEKLTQRVPEEAQVWAEYAEVQAMNSGKKLSGIPAKLISKALEIDPNNFKALALSGSVAMEQGDFSAAVRHWEKLLTLIPKDDENIKALEEAIQQGRVLAAQKSGVQIPALVQKKSKNEPQKLAGIGKESITGTVTLSKTMKSKTSPDDTVFVLVRAAQGPKMPLAIVRKQVKDLPFSFALDDTSAMSPLMKVSNFDQVVVVARVSKSGTAMTQPGDIQGTSTVVKPGASGLQISIDKIIQ